MQFTRHVFVIAHFHAAGAEIGRGLELSRHSVNRLGGGWVEPSRDSHCSGHYGALLLQVVLLLLVE